VSDFICKTDKPQDYYRRTGKKSTMRTKKSTGEVVQKFQRSRTEIPPQWNKTCTTVRPTALCGACFIIGNGKHLLGAAWPKTGSESIT
jgi:hypothetical protein